MSIKLLDDPELESSHNLVDRGADSLTAMMLLDNCVKS